jgi:very-short-patch-repair endonuclease
VDGARWHADAARDRHTDNLLAALGWRVMRFSGVEVLRDTGSVVDRIRAATGAAGGTPSTHQGPVVRRGAA